MSCHRAGGSRGPINVDSARSAKLDDVVCQVSSIRRIRVNVRLTHNDVNRLTVLVGILFQIRTRLCPRSVTISRRPSDVTATGLSMFVAVA